MLQDTIKQYFTLRQTLKDLLKDFQLQLRDDPQYMEFADDLRATSEVLLSYKKSLIEKTPALKAVHADIKARRDELGILRDAITGSVVAVSREDGAQIQQLTFRF